MSFSGRSFSTAFVGVSIDNPKFNPSLNEPLFDYLLATHARVVITVADDLAYFNYFDITCASDPKKAVQKASESVNRYFEGLVAKYASRPDAPPIEQRDWAAFYSAEFYRLVRGLYLIVAHSESLARQLQRRAEAVAHARRRVYNKSDGVAFEQERLKNFGYILEETAVAILAAQEFKTSDEYYPGDRADFLYHVYQVLSEQRLSQEIGIRPHTKRFWNVQISTKGRLQRELIWEATII